MCDQCSGRKRRKRRNRGFLLEQFLIPLLTALMLVPLMTSCLGILGRSSGLSQDLQDEIALAQLRHVLIVSDEYAVSSYAVSCIYHDEPIRIEQVNRFLLVRPGTWIFLSDIDTCQFALENDCIVLYYSRKNSQFRRVLVHA